MAKYFTKENTCPKYCPKTKLNFKNNIFFFTLEHGCGPKSKKNLRLISSFCLKLNKFSRLNLGKEIILLSTQNHARRTGSFLENLKRINFTSNKTLLYRQLGNNLTFKIQYFFFFKYKKPTQFSTRKTLKWKQKKTHR